MNTNNEIRALLQAFQEGYTRRNLSEVDAFMQFFTPDAEVIGINGARPGVDEWYLTRDAARELVHGDWESWGDLRLDMETAAIHGHDSVGWVAATATVTQTIGAENYAGYLDFIQDFLEKSPLPAEEKLHYILRGGTNTVYELSRGEKFVWPLRLTAVVVHEAEGWKFAQIHFSFPTIYFPDVRIIKT